MAETKIVQKNAYVWLPEAKGLKFSTIYGMFFVYINVMVLKMQ